MKTMFLKKDALLILILTGILLLVIAWPVEGDSQGREEEGLLSTGPADTETGADAVSEKEGRDSGRLEESLEERLEEILSLTQGVGRVRVMITLASTGERIVEKDSPTNRSNVVENDAQGGSRSTNEMQAQESTVYMTNAKGEQIPYVTREVSPVVEGVTVVAQGGGDAQVQKNITEVIQALFGIEAHKIKVVKMKQE
ncbi:MAG: stage III sporulation protein AG [Lachnospiraceae bacterium]|nr:stage III sporulation protein AG [Lachnospiraceae bacterium]